MGFQDDYILRMIENMGRALAGIILGRRAAEYVLPEENEFTDTDFLYRDLTKMADEGDINSAENILLTEMKEGDKRYLEMAIGFYQYINNFSDDFLEENQYSRQEILDGLEALAADNGIKGLDALTMDI